MTTAVPPGAATTEVGGLVVGVGVAVEGVPPLLPQLPGTLISIVDTVFWGVGVGGWFGWQERLFMHSYAPSHNLFLPHPPTHPPTHSRTYD